VFPIIGLEFFGLALLITTMSMSTMAGVGGGSVFVPFCMTFYGFHTKEAIALSGFTIFLCAVTRFVFVLRI